MNEILKYKIVIVCLLIIILFMFVFMKSQIIYFNDIVCKNCVRSYLENQTHMITSGFFE